MLPSDNLIAAANIQPASLVHHPIDVALSPSLRERLTQAAHPLFAHRGIKDVTLEEIKCAAGLATEELASVYSFRDEAAADFLARRSRDWTIATVEAGARKRGTTPEERLLAIFDVFDDWFHRDDFEACSFINFLLEMGAAHLLGKASIEYLVHIRQIVTTLAEEADLREPAEFTHSWHILMKSSIISASEGDVHAAKRPKKMARALIREHRNPGSAVAERTPAGFQRLPQAARGSTAPWRTAQTRAGPTGTTFSRQGLRSPDCSSLMQRPVNSPSTTTTTRTDRSRDSGNQIPRPRILRHLMIRRHGRASAALSPGVAARAPPCVTVRTSTDHRSTTDARVPGPPATIAVASTSANSMSSATTVA